MPPEDLDPYATAGGAIVLLLRGAQRAVACRCLSSLLSSLFFSDRSLSPASARGGRRWSRRCCCSWWCCCRWCCCGGGERGRLADGKRSSLERGGWSCSFVRFASGFACVGQYCTVVMIGSVWCVSSCCWSDVIELCEEGAPKDKSNKEGSSCLTSGNVALGEPLSPPVVLPQSPYNAKACLLRGHIALPNPARIH